MLNYGARGVVKIHGIKKEGHYEIKNQNAILNP